MLDDELGKLIASHVDTLHNLGWPALRKAVRGRGDIRVQHLAASHPAYQLLKRLEDSGAPALMSTTPWSRRKLNRLIRRGSHKSCDDHLQFLREELLDFASKGFWLVLPYREVRRLQKLGHLIGLRVSPLGVVPQRNRRPRLIVDLTFHDINKDTVPLAPTEAMQFGRALERILYSIRHSNPRFGPVYLSKVDLSDGFYRVGINDSATAKLAVALPKFPDEEQLLALPLVLPMGWVSSPPYFCAVTETIADLVNSWPANVQPPPHPLETVSQTCPPDEPIPPTTRKQPHASFPSLASLQPAPTCPLTGCQPDTAIPPLGSLRPGPTRSQTACQPDTTGTQPPGSRWPGPTRSQTSDQPTAVAPPLLPRQPGPTRSQTSPQPDTGTPIPASLRPGPTRQFGPSVKGRSVQYPPVLRPFTKPLRFTDIYMDDFMQATQGPPAARLAQLRRLLHAIDSVFRPVDDADPSSRTPVPSMKKFLAGDAYLSIRKVILGWLLNTLAQTLTLPPHRLERLQHIFDTLRDKDRVSVKMWHKFLGELRSMALGIPGSRGLFSLLQEGLRHTDRHRIRITPEMRDQLSDFEHLAHTLKDRPTHLSEIVPDHPVALGPHDASGLGMGGAWLPATTNTNIPPLVWRAPFPQWVRDDLVSFKNPHGTITNSDLELAGLLVHQDVLAQTVNVAGRTLAPLGDNTPTTAWSHKKSTTTTGPPAYLLRLNSIHQRHFRYNSYASYLPGSANGMADDPSRLWHLSDSHLLTHFESSYPQALPWQLATPRPEMISSVLLALSKRRADLQSLLNSPPTKMACGGNGKPSFPLLMESTPTSTPSNPTSTYLFSKFSPTKSATATPSPAASLSQLNEYRATYGPSPRRSVWGPHGAQTRALASTSSNISP